MNIPRDLERLERDFRAFRDDTNRQFDTLRSDAIGKIHALLGDARAYVDARLYRAEVVTPLPANAPAGKFLVTPGDPNLYVGTGAANPLRKIPTQAV